MDAGESGADRLWKYLSIPVAAAAVIGALILIQGSGGGNEQPSSAPAPVAPVLAPAGAAGNGSGSSKGGELVKGSSYTLVLPDGWTAEPDDQHVQLDAGVETTVSFEVSPRGASVLRARVAADVTVAGTRFGQQAEALVTVE
jgi:hypothetical protein